MNGVATREKVIVDTGAPPEVVRVDAVPRVDTRRAWFALGVAVVAVLGLYTPVIASMAAEWSEFPSLSHGFAIPFISAYLLWSRRHLLAGAPVQGSIVGLPLIVLAVGMLLVGSLGAEPFLARFSLPIVLIGTVLFLMGTSVARHSRVAVAYLTLMIPLPYLTLTALTYRSRLFDAGVTATVLGWLGVPVLREGVMLQLPNMRLVVADDCSSVPAIAALLALGAAYAQLHARPTWVRTVLTLAAAPLGLLSNIVRIILTSLGAYYFGPVALGNVIHKFGGTTVFLATVLLLIVFDSVLSRFYEKAES